ncbi:MAG: ribonuclease Z [Cytophagales bacterium]
MNFDITILGSGSASPRLDRMPTAQHVKIHNYYFLFDCGECTQFQLIKYNISALKLDAIFITHLHGDHYLGLSGLLTSMAMLGRKRNLKIYAPHGLKELIYNQIFKDKTPPVFEIEFINTNPTNPETILSNEHFYIKSIPLAHGIECCGFLIQEIEKNKLDKTKIQHLKQHEIISLKNKKNIFDNNGNLTHNWEDYSLPLSLPRSYAYITDTQYLENIIPELTNCNVLYHESTFLEELRDRATKTQHSTAKDAAKIAQLSKVKKLILGHFSSRYEDLSKFEAEAKEIFPEVILAHDGMKFSL